MLSGWGYLKFIAVPVGAVVVSAAGCFRGPLQHNGALCDIAPGVRIKVNGSAAGCPWFVAARKGKNQSAVTPDCAGELFIARGVNENAKIQDARRDPVFQDARRDPVFLILDINPVEHLSAKDHLFG